MTSHRMYVNGRRGLGLAAAASTAMVAVTGCGVYDHFAGEANSGSVALGVSDGRLEVLIGVCEVQPDVIHLRALWAPWDEADLATWEFAGVREGAYSLTSKAPGVVQTAGPALIPVPRRSVTVWVEPQMGIKFFPSTEAKPDQLDALAGDEVLTSDLNGQPLVMTRDEYQDNHCLGPSD